MGKLTNNKTLLKWGILLFVFIPIVIFVFQTDFGAVRQGLFRIGFKFVYIVLVTFSAYLIATWGWYCCLGTKRKKISIYQLFAIRQIGETIALYNPTSIVGGDLLKAELLKSNHISAETAINSVVISRMTAMLSQILLFAVALIWILSTSLQQTSTAKLEPFLYAGIGLLLLVKGYFFYWLATPIKNKDFSPTPLSFWKKNKARMLERLWDVKKFFQHNQKMFWTSYILFAAHWIVGSIEFYLILAFLGLDVQIIQTLLVDMSVIVIKSLLAFIPGQIGIEELANKLMLSFIGISATSIWITASIMRRSRQLFWIGAGFIFYLLIKKHPQHATT